jgi:MFS family permease
MSLRHLLDTPGGRRLLFALLYASEGAPIGFIWWALPARLRAAGVAVEQITLITAAVALPWAFKFLWAPLIDIVRGPRWKQREWILLCQLLMGLALLPLLLLDWQHDLHLMLAFLLVHAVAAATQDVAVDALCIATVGPEERGSINGWMQTGMLLGRSVMGGGALVLAAAFGQAAMIATLVGLIWFSLIVLAVQDDGGHGITGTSPAAGYVAGIRRVVQHPATWLGFVFALISGAGFEAVGATAGPFMIDRGLTEEQVGYFFSLISVPLMIGGALTGGWVVDRWGKVAACATFLVLLSVAIWIVAVIDLGPMRGQPIVQFASLALVYAAIGLFTASSYALFMDLTDPSLGATQFSAYMAMTNLCEAWAGFACGRLVAALGYPTAFAIMAGISLSALPLLARMRRSVPVSA